MWKGINDGVNTLNQVSFISTEKWATELTETVRVNTLNQVSFISTALFQKLLKLRDSEAFFAGNYQIILKKCVFLPFFCFSKNVTIIIQSL